MRASCPFLLILLSLPMGAWAQAPETPAPPEAPAPEAPAPEAPAPETPAPEPPAPRDPLHGLERPLDLAGRAGERWFGLYRRGKSLGTLRLAVKVAGEGLEVALAARVKVGDAALAVDEELVLDARLALLRGVTRQREGEAPEERLELARQADGYEARAREGEAPARVWRCRPAGRLVLGLAHRLLLAEACDPAATGEAELCEPAPEAERGRPLRLSLRPSGERDPSLAAGEHEVAVWIAPPRGSAREVSGWRCLRRGARVERFVALEHGGLVFASAKDEADARRDRPGPPPLEPDSPRGVVLRFLEALLAGDARQAEACCDWEALYRNLGGSGDLAAWKTRFLERLAARGKDPDRSSPEELEDAVRAATVEELEGGRRRIGAEGVRFVLGRAGQGPWRVVDIDG